MSKGEHRRFTVEQKLEILREAEQSGVTVSQVCVHHKLPLALDGKSVAIELQAALSGKAPELRA